MPPSRVALGNSLWPLLGGGVFLAESLPCHPGWVQSHRVDGVGRRVFRMAPLHHHFELGGAAEQQVVRAFWLVTLVLVIGGIVLRPNG